MVTDQQVRRVFALMNRVKTKALAAVKAGMDRKTARKYQKLGLLPSQVAKPHVWRTRKDPFVETWDTVREMIERQPGLEAKTIFEHLQRTCPGEYQDGQLRTLQRRLKHWRATEGPAKEVFFPQIHHPGALCASDFTHMTSLGVTIQNQLFEHLVYHLVLTYSNWESVRVCFSESFESLSEGLQNSLWKLGGVPLRHRSDRMSAAVHEELDREKFTLRYQTLMRHYGMEPEATNPASGNENGDAEQAHYRFKRAVEQALLLRGSRDFASREAYAAFLEGIVSKRNLGRSERFSEEVPLLRKLPLRRLDEKADFEVTVGPSSTVRVGENVYSVHSRLIGERVCVHVRPDHLEVHYAAKLVERLPRLRGRGNAKIDYRHIIDWLVRKPGAFAGYRYRAELFPSSYFRMAYDEFKKQNPLRADKEYLRILKIAAEEGEETTKAALRELLSQKERPLSAETVKAVIDSTRGVVCPVEVRVLEPDLSGYDALLACSEGALR